MIQRINCGVRLAGGLLMLALKWIAVLMVMAPRLLAEPMPVLNNDSEKLSFLIHLQRTIPGLFEDAAKHDTDLLDLLDRQQKMEEKLKANPAFLRLLAKRGPIKTIRIEPRGGKTVAAFQIDPAAIAAWRAELLTVLKEDWTKALRDDAGHPTANETAGKLAALLPKDKLPEGGFRTLFGWPADRQREFLLENLPPTVDLSRAGLRLKEKAMPREKAVALIEASRKRDRERGLLTELHILLQNPQGKITVGLAEANRKISGLSEADLDVFQDPHVYQARLAALKREMAVDGKEPKNLGATVADHMKAIASRKVEVVHEGGDALELVEVPPFVGVMRGCAGGDCASSTHPMFANSPMERVFLVKGRKGVKGYVQTTMVEVDGKPTLYVSCLQGWRISPAEVESILLGLEQSKKELGVEHLVLLRNGLMSGQINNSALHRPLELANQRGRKVSVVHLDTSVRSTFPHQSYDGASRHSEGVLYVPPAEKSDVAVKVADSKPIDFKYAPPTRADVALFAFDLAEVESQQNLQRVLRLPEAGMDSAQFARLQSTFENHSARPLGEYFAAVKAELTKLGVSDTEALLKSREYVFYDGALRSADVLDGTRFRALPEAQRHLVVHYLSKEMESYDDIKEAYKVIGANRDYLSKDAGFLKFLKRLANDEVEDATSTIHRLLELGISGPEVSDAIKPLLERAVIKLNKNPTEPSGKSEKLVLMFWDSLPRELIPQAWLDAKLFSGKPDEFLSAAALVERLRKRGLEFKTIRPETEALILQQLRNESWTVRQQTIQFLSSLSAHEPLGTPLVGHLVGMLSDRDNDVRRAAREAIYALSHKGQVGKEHAPAFANLVGTTHSEVQSVGHNFLVWFAKSQLVTPDVVKSLEARLDSCASGWCAMQTLKEVAHLQGEELSERVLLQAAKDYHANGVAKAIIDETLTKRPLSAEVQRRLTDHLRNESWTVRQNTVNLMLALSKHHTLTSAQVAMIVSHLSDRDNDVRRTARDAAYDLSGRGQVGAEHAPALADIVGTTNSEVQNVGHNFLVWFAKSKLVKPEVIQRLEARLDSCASGWCAMQTLKEVTQLQGEELSERVLLQAAKDYHVNGVAKAVIDETLTKRPLSTEVQRRLTDHLRNESWTVRQNTVNLLLALSRHHNLTSAQVAMIVSHLSDRDNDVRRTARDALYDLSGRGHVGQEHVQALASIVGTTNSEVQNVGHNFLVWFAKSKLVKPEVIQSLEARLDSCASGWCAMQTLKEVAQHQGEELSERVLRQAAKDYHANGVAKAIIDETLTKRPLSAEVQRSLTDHLRNESWTVRQNTVNLMLALSKHHTLTSAQVAMIVSHLSDRDNDVRRTARDAAYDLSGRGQVGAEHAPALANLVGTTHSEVQSVGHHFLVWFAKSKLVKPEVIQSLEARLDSCASGWCAMQTLKEVADHQGASLSEAVLLQAAKDYHANSVARSVIEATSPRQLLSAAVMSRMAIHLRNDSWQIRQNAITALVGLSAHQPLSDSIRLAIHQLEQDRDSDVRRTAAQAMVEIARRQALCTNSFAHLAVPQEAG